MATNQQLIGDLYNHACGVRHKLDEARMASPECVPALRRLIEINLGSTIPGDELGQLIEKLKKEAGEDFPKSVVHDMLSVRRLAIRLTTMSQSADLVVALIWGIIDEYPDCDTKRANLLAALQTRHLSG